MPLTVAEEANFLRLSGDLLTRLGSDPNFAETFNTDPAAAMQELFPELRFISKAQIAAEIASSNESFLKFASARTTPNDTGTSIGSTLMVFRSSFARSLVTAGLVSHLARTFPPSSLGGAQFVRNGYILGAFRGTDGRGGTNPSSSVEPAPE